ncbi:MAG: hypothetical protein HDT22_03885 [Ruminococcus sp.]|nr:hypothetical protein [Ruminococcus sp.]
MIKEILIMAKSEKLGNYCIAGFDMATKQWIRVVSDKDSMQNAVPRDIKYDNGGDVNVLDIVEINFIKPTPTQAQSENWLYDSKIPWKKCGTVRLEDVIKWRDTDNCNKVFRNLGKVVFPDSASGESLLFLKIENPKVRKKTVESYYYKNVLETRLYIDFSYKGNQYEELPIRDPEICERYRGCENGDYSLGLQSAYAVFSLPEIFENTGKHHKILAKLFI